MTFIPGGDIEITDFTGFIWPFGGSSAPTGFLLCDGQEVSRTTYSRLFNVIGTGYGSGDGSTTFNIPDLRSSTLVGAGQRTEEFEFADGDVNTTSDEITVRDNQWLYTGKEVTLSTTGTLPSGLSAGTYYIIRVNSTTIQLATSRDNAAAGNDIDITGAAGGGTHTVTLTLTNKSIGDAGGEEDHMTTESEMARHWHGVPNDYTGGSGQNFNEGIQIDSYVGEGSSPLYDRLVLDDQGDQHPVTEQRGSNTPHNNMPPHETVNFVIKT